ncbi:unnamed protein product [Cylicostephanus goldi]|uniref:Uncharacterized protein n=1 Tax=Cylicostephanus goldi TaxID=71465 RepID=A0A3P6S3J7_CYLGO|nr:unnamed protein product [Cylicostephanus goldi]
MIVWCNRRQVGIQKFYENQKELVEAWKEDEKILNTVVDHEAKAKKDQRTKVSGSTYSTDRNYKQTRKME